MLIYETLDFFCIKVNQDDIIYICTHQHSVVGLMVCEEVLHIRTVHAVVRLLFIDRFDDYHVGCHRSEGSRLFQFDDSSKK